MLLIFLFAFSSAFYDGRCIIHNYNTTRRDDLIGCFSQLVDKNSDGILNATEITNFNTACCSTWGELAMTPKDYFEMTCDMNHDGVLDLSDWNHRHACCKDSGCLGQLCSFCYQHGWTGPPSK